MRNIFIDINILVDIFANREPFVHKSLSIYNLAIKRKIKLYSSSNTITTLHYILKKSISEEKTRLALEHVIEHVLIIPVDINIIKKSLKSNHKDFEDAIQITSAQSINTIECIVTRDLKDYKNAEMKVLSPDEFLNTL
jgi:predicted nucleic acid-binding protein